jgi:serine/threonine-protein kinase
VDFGLARPADGAGPVDEVDESRAHLETENGGTLTRLAAIAMRGSEVVVTGTPGHMSPEQARGERVTAASDMYAFGLLLQEVFTGRPAYPRDLSPAELLELAADGDTVPVEGVDAEVRALIERLQSPAPEARPRAAEAVAVLARIRDRPRRRRRRLALAAAIAALVAAGVKYGVDLRRERNQAESARVEAEVARREAEQVTQFLVELFDASRPEMAAGREITVGEILDLGQERIDNLAEQPAVQGRLLSTFGDVHLGLGDYGRSAEYYERAARVLAVTGSAAGDVADNLRSSAYARLYLGETAAARELCREALELARSHELGGLERSKNLYCLAWILNEEGRPAEAAAYQEQVVEIRRRELAGSGELAAALTTLAIIQLDAGNPDGAEPVLREALELRERLSGLDHPQRATLLDGLARVFRLRGELAAAADHARQALDVRRRTLGEEHADVAHSYLELAALHLLRGRTEPALGLLARSEKIWRRTLGEDAEPLAGIHALRARAHGIRGEHVAAVAEYEKAIARWRESLGDDHPLLGEGWTAAAPSLVARGRVDEAAEGLRRAIAIFEARPDESSPLFLADALSRLATLLTEQDAADEARGLLERAEGLEPLRSPSSPAARRRLAEVHLARGLLEEAAGDPRTADRRYRAAISLLEPLAAASEDVMLLEVLVRALLAAGQVDDACRWVEKLSATDWRRPELQEPCRR